MKKAIIIGSSKGYGASISKTLKNKGIFTVGLSRNDGGLNDAYFPITDVSNIDIFSSEITNALDAHLDIDTAIFVTGDAVLKNPLEHSDKDLKYALDVNLGYVVKAVKRLKEKGDMKNIITFGSQWSYTENNKAMASYCVAKHLLKHFTYLLNESDIKAFHFCVPTSKTEKALIISNYLDSVEQPLPLQATDWAEPDQIANMIIEEVMHPSSGNHLYRFQAIPEGSWALATIENSTDTIDAQISKLGLDDFNDEAILFDVAKKAYENLVKTDAAQATK